MKISCANVSALPGIREVMWICQATALLDAILQPVWDLRYFSFNPRWTNGESMASMCNGSGEAFFLVFKPEGAILLAQIPHSPVGARVARLGTLLPETFTDVPRVFQDVLSELAFSTCETTFYLWRLADDAVWKVGGETADDQNHSSGVLFALDSRPETYQKWTEGYFEIPVPLEMVVAIYSHAPLTQDLIQSLNSEMTMAKLADDLGEIGYGVATSTCE